MKYNKWNTLDKKKNVFFVLDAHTHNIVLHNYIFDELLSGTGMDIHQLLALGIDMDKILAYLTQEKPATSADGLNVTPGMAHVYQKTITHLVMDKFIDVKVTAGFFNQEQTEIYFVLDGYTDILEFIRFKNSIAKIPENIALLELNDDLSFYNGNQAFEQTFSTPEISFGEKFNGSFAAALSPIHRKSYLSEIQQIIATGEKRSFVAELYTAGGVRHHVLISAKPIDEMLNHTLLCVSIQLVDDNAAERARHQRAIEVYNTAFGFSQSVAFHLELPSLQVEFYGKLAENFHLQNINEDFISYATKRNIIYQDDLPVFHDMMRHIQKGIERQFRLRINALDGRCDWYLVVYKILRDGLGNPTAAQGTVSNIQLTKDLQEKADTDLLTECLNKGAFEMQVHALFQDNATQNNAFLVIDIDNFKAINDNFGHFFGDIVLKEIATKLRRIFREDDLVARIGGDEFAVLMRKVDDLSVVERKAEAITKALDITYKGNNGFYRITASVGVSTSPRDASSFEQLYKNADTALYRAKADGKNNFAIYAPSMDCGTMDNRTPIDLANRAMASHFNQEIAIDAFNLLFETTGNANSVDLLLRHLGEFYHVDRCYVFEINATDPTCYDNTYEWCAQGIEPQKDQLQGLPLSAFQETFDMANEDGVYYCNDINTIQSEETRQTLAVQGIQSVVLTFVKRNGQVEYVLGFDDCTAKRLWKPMEISTLSYTSKIIAQYLLYKRAISYQANLAQERTAVLDSLTFYAYIIDLQTYELMYFNQRTKFSIPNLKPGDICYKALRGLDAPCQDCPLATLRSHPEAKRVRKLIHNDPLNMDVLVTSSYLEQFNGRPCIFVSSSNIDDIVQITNIKDFDPELFTAIECFDMAPTDDTP